MERLTEIDYLAQKNMFKFTLAKILVEAIGSMENSENSVPIVGIR